ncbi:MAG: rhamnogalacturonan lyase [Bryobacteraceae bacterium]|nr:rhamnogalacturonan lyase [Bryobacteraceae bacterium]MDW8377130.1 rhamnogalacturonan lyase [Bryobacterales bacterium]
MSAIAFMACLCGSLLAAPLGRGVIAVRVSPTDVFISWRLLRSDPANAAFHVYRVTDQEPPKRLNDTPLRGATHFTDRTADLTRENSYLVLAVSDGVELHPPGKPFVLPANTPIRPYLSIPIEPPPGGRTPDGVAYSYEANDGSAADLDGDGELELVLKWEPTNAKDNAQSGYTGPVYLDAYQLDGSRLWRIDLGPNIRAGAHYTQFLVYDLDGDERAEVVVKTAPGTRDSAGHYVASDPNRFFGEPPRFEMGEDHRNSAGYILTGYEFFTIFDGFTGQELVSTYYEPPRNRDIRSSNVSAWGDNYGNRVDRFLAAVAYLDGKRPSFVLCRGYYTRAVLVAWNWREGKLTRVWTFDSDDGTPGNAAYRGQGNHNLSVADVDGDGKDEIIYGAAAIDDDGRGLYSTGRGHGDALHVSDMDPARPGLEAFQPHETPALYGPNALDYRDAATGELICGVEATGDIGRGVAMDIDPRYPGYEFWGSGNTGGLYNVQTCDPDPVKGPRARPISPSKPRQINFGIWWDGDLLRELLDGTTISKWDWESGTTITLLSPPGVASNNGTKATPVLSGDLLGDWREEVIWRSEDNRELRLYTTTIPTRYRMLSLLEDRQYRLAMVWQNVGYNQPPHPSFYLGEGMPLP